MLGQASGSQCSVAGAQAAPLETCRQLLAAHAADMGHRLCNAAMELPISVLSFVITDACVQIQGPGLPLGSSQHLRIGARLASAALPLVPHQPDFKVWPS